ncbi:phosphoenolpyruvate-dependent sugar PTS family porter, EIIA 2 [Amylolactobacillus amylotrophicus DSM 20534]|uniref:Phosphoenolpyruvate-dependent sugar PTS family porter, EIIA 2 n=3 Tax=Amylolactobacillus TaxID=2767876 RepID=A0A0R1YQR9_9LACO|nr:MULTISPECIES: PTS sugar transporter subunit IIA [Amylolactobacillus]APT18372.1 PTS sugar transporter subunit IIA [Amylolactobacillus amylophilus DSM 20533 = JCM 1125]KRK38162.1 phosphoenolpyruvate-dependent sugar PTS family porter, EIIA 2 [Amylolactobacillus amylotrophicus DSM 20534]KRM43204.1 phosphoenolpyruvate-dependent sugar PTS family porter, EIIA 2 [Amylolactobacillus amylophilus DSM 20533 = JCM 1125]GED80392.1 PTS sugar transporter subunit IIA [Amylolactobacillus amylophilus]
MKKTLFAPDAVFISKETSRDAVFEDVARQLLQAGYVKDDFLCNLKERENNYPTGIDITPISTELANVAIPHTEGEFVNARLIVPVKLTQEVTFKNMILPDEELSVKFLFMILNNDPEGQANVLAQIMDFLSQTPVADLQQLFASEDTTAIYQFLATHFKEDI